MKKIIFVLALTGLAPLLNAQTPYQSPYFNWVKLDEKAFTELKKNAKNYDKEVKKITDFETAKKMLKDTVVWGYSYYEDPPCAECPKIIKFKNGKKFTFDEGSHFISYFPEEDVLKLEGGHSSDVIFDLKTGEREEFAGDPELRKTSPSGVYRINRFYTGHSGQSFIQQKKSRGYETAIDLTSELWESGILAEATLDLAWIGDNAFIFKIYADAYKTEFFKITLKLPRYYAATAPGMNLREKPDVSSKILASVLGESFVIHLLDEKSGDWEKVYVTSYLPGTAQVKYIKEGWMKTVAGNGESNLSLIP